MIREFCLLAPEVLPAADGQGACGRDECGAGIAPSETCEAISETQGEEAAALLYGRGPPVPDDAVHLTLGHKEQGLQSGSDLLEMMNYIEHGKNIKQEAKVIRDGRLHSDPIVVCSQSLNALHRTIVQDIHSPAKPLSQFHVSLIGICERTEAGEVQCWKKANGSIYGIFQVSEDPWIYLIMMQVLLPAQSVSQRKQMISKCHVNRRPDDALVDKMK